MAVEGNKVFVGISGGVDSAVAAALLQEQGYDVTGVFIKIQIPGYPCPAAADRIDAMRVAAHLKIPFMEIDLSNEYEREVFRPSLDEYAKGHTPNPDTLCNEKIKFGAFYEFARSHGADFIATGHYARLAFAAKPPSQKVLGSASPQPDHFVQEVSLLQGLDINKDQSYFLWMVPETVLRYTLFPIGHLQKSAVRALAEKYNLPNAARPDSQGLCFLGDISIEEMLEREIPHTLGEVLSEAGEVIGTHEGAVHYTMGQRHGFTLSTQTAHTTPHFIVAKDVARNTITVSTGRFPVHASKTILTLQHINWIGALPQGPLMARYRYRQKLIPAELQRSDPGKGFKGQTFVILLEPHYVPVGQSLVLYSGNRCLGGGVISDATLQK
ncbi:MAG: tRNA 2-thiouridine(34) synthase MnmA [Patescibacteria group bacterium]